MSSPILLDIRDQVATITLNRPEKMNALAGTMRGDLLQAIESVAADLEVRVLVITGAGKAFCAGGDIDYMAELKRQDAPFQKIGALMDCGRRVVTALQNLGRPVIAAVNGPAAGAGLNLALACDLRIASDAASFGATFSRIGLHPDWGGTWFLPRLVGPSRALKMIWTGEIVGAAEAHRIGLVDEVVPAAELGAAVAALAGRLAQAPPVAVEYAKRAIAMSDRAGLLEMIGFEMEAQEACWESRDSAEGINAFIEKRTPRFGGHHG